MSWKSELQSKIAGLRQKHGAQDAAKEQLLRDPAAVFEQMRQQALGMQNSPYAYGAPLRAWPQGQQHQGLGQQWQGAQIQPGQIFSGRNIFEPAPVPLCPDCAALPKLRSLHQDVIAAALLAPALVPRLRLYEAVVAAARALLKTGLSLSGLEAQALLALLHRLDTCELDAE